MRRLATQQRGGAVSSARDYQTIAELGKPILFVPGKHGVPASLILRYTGQAKKCDVAAFGGYIASTVDFSVHISVTDASGKVRYADDLAIEGQKYWTRVGETWIQDCESDRWTIILRWKGESNLFVWGLSVSKLSLPDFVSRFVQDCTDGIEYLNQRHLAPESFYLQHDSPMGGATVESLENIEVMDADRPNPGKKCSQCQRSLPIDPRLEKHRVELKVARRSPQGMVLAFHGHKAKKTGYQNECRACKKFEINDFFNVRRTSDQLHESSVLTRERKLLLRENEALAEFKERVSKKGLRHYIWTLFQKRCFKCDKPVSLKDYELDHTRPLSYLWPLDRHATCLCSTCNNNKKDSFPSEFYSEQELKRLAHIIGLPVSQLKDKSINQEELKRIREDIVTFAETWTPRLFSSVAVRVMDLLPDIDLFAELQAASPDLHSRLVATLSLRPSPVLSEEDLEHLNLSEE